MSSKSPDQILLAPKVFIEQEESQYFARTSENGQ